MLKLNRKVEYSLITLSHLADCGDLPVSTRALADRYAIPLELLSKVLQLLVRRKLLLSVQGKSGGYSLARPAEEISLKEIIEAVDGNLLLVNCTDDKPNTCRQAPNCNINEPLALIQEALRDFFEHISLADFNRGRVPRWLPPTLSENEKQPANGS